MSAFVCPLVLFGLLTAFTLAGPMLLRTTAPALMRVPRTAVLLLAGTVVMWLAALASPILLLAFTLTGPSLLSGPIADVCQRCLAAASPFGQPFTVATPVPVVLLLALPAVFALTVSVVGVVRTWMRGRTTRRVAHDLLVGAHRTHIDGHSVLLIKDARPIAFSFPRRWGGIVISDDLCDALSSQERAAVLAHERAHLDQRHHLVMTVLTGMTWPLRWIPLIAAIADAIPHYLEIAADNAAREHTSTPIVASALLKLGSPQISASGALHAAGPNRIRQLVAPRAPRMAALPLAALGGILLAFAVTAGVIHGPYLAVALTGCRLPI